MRGVQCEVIFSERICASFFWSPIFHLLSGGVRSSECLILRDFIEIGFIQFCIWLFITFMATDEGNRNMLVVVMLEGEKISFKCENKF